MKKSLVIIGIIILIIVIGVGALYFVVRAYLTPEKVSALLSQKLESSLHHKVTLGPVTTGFSSANVQNLTLFSKNPKDKTPILTIKEVNLSFSLIPLLKKRLDIQKIVIISPNLYLVREKNGRLNWQEEFKKISLNLEERKNPSGTGFSLVSSAYAKEAADPMSSSFAIQVEKLEIRNGTVAWMDRTLTPIYKASLTSIMVDLENFSLKKPISFHVKGILKRKKGTRFELKGRFYLARKNLEATLHLNPVFLTDITPYTEKRKVRFLGGRGDLNLEVSSQRLKSWVVTQKISLQSVRIQAQHRTTRPFEASLQLDASLDLNRDTLSLKSLKGKLMNTDFSLHGRLERLHSSPTGTFRLVSNRMDLDTLLGVSGFAHNVSEKGAEKSTPVKPLKKSKGAPISKKGRGGFVPLPTLTIQSMIHHLLIKKIRIEEVRAKLVTKGHKAILNPFSARIYGGTVKGIFLIDLSHSSPIVKEKVSIEDVDMASFFTDLKPKMKGKFTGHLFGKTRGEGAIEVPSTYKGKILFHVEKGSIKNSGILKVAAILLRLPSLTNLQFDRLEGKIYIKNRKAVVESADARAKDLLLNVKGVISFEKKLDLYARLEVPYRVIRIALGKRSELFAYRTDTAGKKWTIIPLKIKGTTTHPLVTVRFEKKAVERMIEKNVHGKTIKKLLEKLFR